VTWRSREWSMGDRAVKGEMLEVHRSEHAKVWLCSDLPNWAVTQVLGSLGVVYRTRNTKL